MKKLNFKAAALVAAAVATAVLTACSGEESWAPVATVVEEPDHVVSYTIEGNVENGCPTATATGTAFADGVTEAAATLEVTLAEEQIAIPSDSEFGTEYTSGDWATGFNYSDGQSATVTFNSSSSQLVLTDLVFNQDKTDVTPAADGMSATVTLSYTATINYVVDGVTEATAEVILTPWYTQVKVENTPSVVEPEETFHVVSFEVKDYFGEDGWDAIYGIWTIESNGVVYNERCCFAKFHSGTYSSGVIISHSATLKETRHEFVEILGETTTKGNLTLTEKQVVLYEVINLGNVDPINDSRAMILRDVTFIDPVTGEAHHLDVTGYMTSDYKEVVEDGRQTITTGGNVEYSYDGKSLLFTTYYHIVYTYNGETVEYIPTGCVAEDYHYVGYHYED
jgi:hypothetical protein